MDFDLQNPETSSPKPQARTSTRRQRLAWSAAKSFKSTQICPRFLKTDYTMVFYGLWSTKPKNFTPKKLGTCLHAPPKDSAVRPSIPRADEDSQRSHVPHVHSALWRHGWRHPLLTRWSRFNPDQPVLTRIRTACQKKKVRENTLTK